MLILPRRKLLAGGAVAAAYNRLLMDEAAACTGIVTTQPSGIPIPAQATAAGFTTQKFFDDFNVAGTVDEAGATSGKTFYPATDYGNNAGHCTTDGSVSINGVVTNNAAIKANGNGMPVANITVYPNATATGIQNGNTGGGGFQPSQNGGICTINASTSSAGLGGVATMRSVAASTLGNSIPTSGVITSGYLECYMQFQPQYVCPSQWTALVLYVQKKLVVPGQTLLCSQELDWLESNAGNNGYVGNLSLRNTSGAHCFTDANQQPFAGGNTYGTGQDNNNVPNGFVQITQDCEFHLFGYLKKNTGANAGFIEVYYDNVLVNLYDITNPILSGTACPTTGPNAGWNWAEYFQYYLAISACFFASGTNQASTFATSGNSPTLITPNLNIDYIRLLG